MIDNLTIAVIGFGIGSLALSFGEYVLGKRRTSVHKENS